MSHKHGVVGKPGFTLIEMMIVIAVIAILIGLLLPSFRGTQDEASEQRARAELRTIATALESYFIHNTNQYPTTLTPLTIASPRIISVIPNDPFRGGSTPYTYYVTGQYYVVLSYGRNRSADINGINSSGQMTVAGGGNCANDVWVSNGTGTDSSNNAC